MMTAPKLIRKFPSLSDAELQARFGVSINALRIARWRQENYAANRQQEEARRRRNGILPRAERWRLQSEAIWPGKAIAILEKHWGRKSAAEIAELVGKSRNAVIGKANRLGLPRLK